MEPRFFACLWLLCIFPKKTNQSKYRTVGVSNAYSITTPFHSIDNIRRVCEIKLSRQKLIFPLNVFRRSRIECAALSKVHLCDTFDYDGSTNECNFYRYTEMVQPDTVSHNKTVFMETGFEPGILLFYKRSC